MKSDDFIDLDASCVSEHSNEDDGVHKSNYEPGDADGQPHTPSVKEDIPTGENIETLEENGERKEGQIMDVEVDLRHSQSLLQGSVKLVESVKTVEKVNGIKSEQDKENGCAVALSGGIINNLLIDESPISGVKRARMTYVDQQPSVRVIYNSLTRESKKKLTELLQQWSEWHAQHESSSNAFPKETLEYGEETYFPALHVGIEKSSTVSFWLDNQARNEENQEYVQLDNDSVPIYDRGCTLGAAALDGSADPGRIETLEASRCFNCGSYNHSLKECPKPRDNVAIGNARKQHSSKRNPAAGSRGQARYYQNSPGKFDDLKAGVLGAEARESLGIGEFDPPPWLHRMREMGYPPGYLDIEETEDQPSGITIYADEETKLDYEDGELPEAGEPEPPEKKMTVEFPGINAPIPENADHRRWAAMPAGFSNSNSFKNRPHVRSNRASESHRGQNHDQRRSMDHRDDGPPGSEYGLASSRPAYSPRYSPYDHNPIPRSPILGRSLSDREWRSPLPYEGSPSHSPHSPLPYPGMSRQSPQYHSPTASLEHWRNGSPYSASPDVSSQMRDRHDHRRHHRK